MQSANKLGYGRPPTADWVGRMKGFFQFAAAFIFLIFSLSLHTDAWADPFPPYWGSGAVHYPPVAWPEEPADPTQCGHDCGDWKPYTRFQNTLNDPRIKDPSNGGTAPQNYVNVSSSCIDKDLPSIYYYLHKGATEAEDVLAFRWRVEQIANTYATGPNPGTYGATHPWNSR